MSAQVDGLRRAATILDVPRGQSGILIGEPEQWQALQLPGPAARPLASWLRAVAEDIERHDGRTLGLPVNYALAFAGTLLGEDLGHDR